MTGLLSVPPGNLIRADGLTVDECATVEFLAIGAHAVRRAALTGRERVLVAGAGPIGLGVALFAHLSGSRVAIFDRDPERASAVEAITRVSALTTERGPSPAANEFTGGEDFDVVFDATGNRQSMEKGFDFVAHGGRYVLVSVIKDSIKFTDPDFHRKEMTLFGTRNATK